MPFKYQNGILEASIGLQIKLVKDIANLAHVSIYRVHVLSNHIFRTFQSYQFPLMLDPPIAINGYNFW